MNAREVTPSTRSPWALYIYALHCTAQRCNLGFVYHLTGQRQFINGP
jgi:hypothetical protein